eukprot:GHVT01066065.1.p1 GENE.GHVT01066065.1~~GHVT01066065.1.p1  ORF type:complete len:552 (-),score=63.92 GHVT01066065.1:844-2499(-)
MRSFVCGAFAESAVALISEVCAASCECPAWPPELSMKDRVELLTGISIAGTAAEWHVDPSAFQGPIQAFPPLHLDEEIFVRGTLFLPFNQPDFPAPVEVDADEDRLSTDKLHTVRHRRLLLPSVLPQCMRLLTTSLGPATSPQVDKGLTTAKREADMAFTKAKSEATSCLAIALQVVAVFGAAAPPFRRQLNGRKNVVVPPPAPIILSKLYSLPRVTGDGSKTNTSSTIMEKTKQAEYSQQIRSSFSPVVQGESKQSLSCESLVASYDECRVPYWHVYQAILCSGAVTLEDIQAVLPSVVPLPWIACAVELIVGAVSASCTERDWETLKHPLVTAAEEPEQSRLASQLDSAMQVLCGGYSLKNECKTADSSACYRAHSEATRLGVGRTITQGGVGTALSTAIGGRVSRLGIHWWSCTKDTTDGKPTGAGAAGGFTNAVRKPRDIGKVVTESRHCAAVGACHCGSCRTPSGKAAGRVAALVNGWRTFANHRGLAAAGVDGTGTNDAGVGRSCQVTTLTEICRVFATLLLQSKTLHDIYTCLCKTQAKKPAPY